MTNEELKKKIESIIRNAKRDFAYCVPEEWAVKVLADTLIAAGLTFGNKHRVLVENAPIPTDYIGNECFLIPNTPPTIKQLYGDEEVEQIVKERDTYKRALKLAEELGELCAPASNYIQQAEKELAEEGKNERRNVNV